MITTQIGVGEPFSAPFAVNATAPPALQIYVFSNNTITPNFVPLRDIDPTTVVVNGTPYPNATIAADPVDENRRPPGRDITITPRSKLNLTANTTTFTIRGRTLPGSPNANMTWTGSTTIVVSSSNSSGTAINSAPTVFGTFTQIGYIPPNFYNPDYGPNVFVPPHLLFVDLQLQTDPPRGRLPAVPPLARLPRADHELLPSVDRDHLLPSDG